MKHSSLIGIVMGAALALGFGNVSAYDDDYNRSRHHDQDWAQHDRCNYCGRVERIEYARGRRTSGGGAVAGAIIGGVLGNQVGHGDGRRAATVAGAVLGGIAGNKVERRSSQRRNVYDILVNLDRGRSVWVTQNELRGVREGSRVELRGGRVRLR